MPDRVNHKKKLTWKPIIEEVRKKWETYADQKRLEIWG